MGALRGAALVSHSPCSPMASEPPSQLDEPTRPSVCSLSEVVRFPLRTGDLGDHWYQAAVALPSASFKFEGVRGTDHHGDMAVDSVVIECNHTPEPSPPAPPPLSPSPLPDVTVSTVAQLTSALAASSVTRITLEAGHYRLSDHLRIERPMRIEAAVAGAVVLDGNGANRVLYFGEVTDVGEVQLAGLNITGGTGEGGGAYIHERTVRFISCNFEANQQPEHDQAGGAMYIHGDLASVVVEDSKFSGNSANEGGAITISSGSLQIFDSSIENNLAEVGGGALLLKHGSSTTLIRCSLTNNSAWGSGSPGGAIRMRDESALQLIDVLLADNSVDHSGGAVHLLTTGVVQLESVTFSRNTAGSYGGNTPATLESIRSRCLSRRSGATARSQKLTFTRNDSHIVSTIACGRCALRSLGAGSWESPDQYHVPGPARKLCR